MSEVAMRRFLAAATAAMTLLAGTAGLAQTVYPIDRAEILVDARFDLKIEFLERVAADQIKVTVNGVDYATVFGKTATYVEREDGKEQSALLLRDVSLPQPGVYKVQVSDGTRGWELNWTVYATGSRKAKNVILFIGDGMSGAHRVAARLLAKGMAEGKGIGKLAMDEMQISEECSVGTERVRWN